jgi:toxin YoeB
LGKPEPLKHALAGWWSRRITGEHRLVYRVSGKDAAQLIEIVQCRYHY